MYLRINAKYPLFLSDFKKLDFSRRNLEEYLNVILMKIRPVEAGLFHEDGQTWWS